MSLGRNCIFYRIIDNNSRFGHGIGCCDLGVIWTICEGDMNFCERPEDLIKCLYQEWTRHKTIKKNSDSQLISTL